MKKVFLFLSLILLAGCSSTRFYITDNGFKVAENGSKLEVNDFNNTDFFVVNPPNRYYKDLNVYAFSLLSDYRKNIQPTSKPVISQKLQKKGEAVLWRNGEAYFVKYDGEKKDYDTYSFLVRIDNAVYSQYCQYIGEFKELKTAEANCQWVLNNCQNPLKTITRQVSVPRTEYQTVTRSVDTYYSGNSYGTYSGDVYGNYYGNVNGSATSYYTTVEPYTVYDTKTEYLTIANPDYNPVKVDQARELLPMVQMEIKKLDAVIVELFFKIFHVEGAASSQNTTIVNPTCNMSSATIAQADCLQNKM